MFFNLWKSKRVLVEDALKHIYDCQYRDVEATIKVLEGVLRQKSKKVLKLIEEMESGGLVKVSGQGLKLTPKGHAWAIQVIRAHRLWESYLSNEVGVPLEKVHERAEKKEHKLSISETNELEAKLGFPTRDPHGDPIPSLDREEEKTQKGMSLLDWPLKKLARIVHIEDEPQSIFTQILVEGLNLDSCIKVLESGDKGLRIWALSNECWLAPIVAANIFVDKAPAWFEEKDVEKLSALQPGEEARVLAIESQGLNRRRMMDLGLVPGTIIKSAMQSALKDPMAYQVRGAMTVLRKEQTDKILIKKIKKGHVKNDK